MEVQCHYKPCHVTTVNEKKLLHRTFFLTSFFGVVLLLPTFIVLRLYHQAQSTYSDVVINPGFAAICCDVGCHQLLVRQLDKVEVFASQFRKRKTLNFDLFIVLLDV